MGDRGPLYPSEPPKAGRWREDFRRQLDALPCAAWVNDVRGDGLMVHVNRAGLALFRASSTDELRSRGTGAQMTPAARQEVESALQRALRGERVARQWTIYPGDEVIHLNVATSYVWLAEDRPALVVTAAPAPYAPLEYRAATMLQHVPIPVFMVGAEGELRHANPAGEKALEQQTWADFLPEDLRPELAELCEQGQRLECSAELSGPHDARLHRWVAARALDPVDGTHAAVLCASDVTDLVAAQRALTQAQANLEREVEQRTLDLAREKNDLAAILDAVRAAVAVVDAHGQVERANRTMLEWLPDVVGQRIDDRLGLEQTELTELTESRIPQTLDTPQGVRTVLWSTRRVPASGHSILTGHDLSERIELQRQLHKSQALASLGRLASTLAHNINNPLTSIIASASLLVEIAESGETLDPKEVGELANACLVGARRSSDVVQHIKATSGAPAEQLKTVTLSEVVHRVTTQVRLRCPKDIKLTTDIAPDLKVRASADRLAQVVAHLLDNAVDAVEAAGGSITLLARQNGPLVHLDVLDDGAGMSNETRIRAFEEFFTTKVTRRGGGLGLPLARALTRAFGGDVTLASRLGEGTQVRVELPIARESTEAAKTSAPVPHGDRVSLLFVDDEAPLRMAVARLLPEVEVRTAPSGKDALTILEQFQPDAILTDMVMANGDGRWLFEQIGSRWPRLAGRVAFTSGGTLDPDVTQFLSSCGRPFLPKPFEPASLRRLMSELTRSTDTERSAQPRLDSRAL